MCQKDMHLLRVSSFSSFHLAAAYISFRHECASESHLKCDVAVYQQGTGDSTLWLHLTKQHLADWVDACDTSDIAITVQTVWHLVDQYRDSQWGTPSAPELSMEQLKYSTAGFTSAITEWVIASDLVQPPSIKHLEQCNLIIYC
jgi:hypothetical protein